jgi:Ser/Thr protein kinase RdoA (MazF antagonist)
VSSNNVTFISEVANYLYGARPELQPLDGFINEVYRLDFKGKVQRKVIKVSRIPGMAEEGFWGGYGEILREQDVIRSLADHGFEVPDIEFTQKDYRSSDIPFTIMPFYSGRSLCEIYETNPDAVEQIIKRVGKFIARLGAIRHEDIPVGFTPHMVKKSYTQWWQIHLETFMKHRLYSKRFEQALRHGQELIGRQPSVFGNNDGVQCITDGEGVFVIIDWGPSGAAWPIADLATRIHLWAAKGDASNVRGINWLPWLMEGYLNGRTLSAEERAALITWRINTCIVDAMFFERIGQGEKTAGFIALAEQLNEA